MACPPDADPHLTSCMYLAPAHQDLPSSRRLWVGIAGLAACEVVGVAMALLQEVGIVLLVALIAAGGVALLVQRRAPFFELGAFGLVGGYIVLNRGFAGLFLPLPGLPLYVGELALAALIVPAIQRLRGTRVGVPEVLLLAWMGYNALLTLPHLQEYGMTAIRDAAIWYYGLFAFVGAAAWRTTTVPRVRRWFLPIFLMAAATLPLSLAQNSGAVPAIQLPISDSPIVGEKWDIATMFLLGAAGLYLTGAARGTAPWPRWSTPLLLGVTLTLVVLPQHRASFTALAVMMVLLFVYRRFRAVLLTLLATAIGLAGLWALDLDLNLMRGMVSTRTVIERQVSILNVFASDTSVRDENDNTVIWRTIWWQALWDEAVDNPRIMAIGRGYGPDLRASVENKRTAILNWEQNADQGRPVRSPHSIAMTILARSGVAGLALWLSLLAVCLGQIARATIVSRRAGKRDDELFGIWLSTYLVAILVVSLFGVVLESPAGAIPFFFLLGLSLAWANDRLAPLAELARTRVPQPARARPRAAGDEPPAHETTGRRRAAGQRSVRRSWPATAVDARVAAPHRP